jgi:hypothetical protein
LCLLLVRSHRSNKGDYENKILQKSKVLIWRKWDDLILFYSHLNYSRKGKMSFFGGGKKKGEHTCTNINVEISYSNILHVEMVNVLKFFILM